MNVLSGQSSIPNNKNARRNGAVGGRSSASNCRKVDVAVLFAEMGVEGAVGGVDAIAQRADLSCLDGSIIVVVRKGVFFFLVTHQELRCGTALVADVASVLPLRAISVRYGNNALHIPRLGQVQVNEL